MRSILQSFLGLCILGAPAPVAFGQEPGDEPVARLIPAPLGAKPLEAKERRTGWYSAVSKLKNTDTRDGIGVRWNWPKDIGDRPWGALGTISLVAFPDEAVAYDLHYRHIAAASVEKVMFPIPLPVHLGTRDRVKVEALLQSVWVKNPL